MNAVIINGSPRKNGNTAELCKIFEDGLRAAAPQSAITQVCLNDYDFKGCQSCFACKLKGGRNYGKCTFKDGITHVLNAVYEADCLVIASPIYLMDVTAGVKAFLERLCFSLGSYEAGYKSLAQKQTKVVTIYTMNTPEDQSPKTAMDNIDGFLCHVFSAPHRICAYNTLQFNDYSKYVVEVFDEKTKSKYKADVWPSLIEQTFSIAYDYAIGIKD